MLKHECSYWLTASLKNPDSTDAQNKLNKLLAELKNCPVAMERQGYMQFGLYGDIITGQVDEDAGTTPQDEYIHSIIAAIAEQFPEFSFIFEENDEEDKSNQLCVKFQDGVKIYENHARVVPADEKYDEPTVNAICEYIKKLDDNLANDIRARFLDK